MLLNSLSPAPGHKTSKKRVGRGIGSGLGKTCGRGHKGQKARKSGNVRPGFEGGQMPLQKRLPKYGFNSRIAQYVAEIRTSDLNLIDSQLITKDVLIEAKLIKSKAKKVKIIFDGEVTRKFNMKGLQVTTGAKKAIEAAGGVIEL